MSFELRRQIGTLIGRSGKIEYVVVGDDSSILIPDLARFRSGTGRLKGLRCIHTHIHGEPLSKEDLMDLALLKLDLMMAVNINGRGLPADINYAYLVAKNDSGRTWITEHVTHIGRLDLDFPKFIIELENEFAKTYKSPGEEKREKAVLVGVTKGSKREAEESLEELKELARTSNLTIADTIVQRRTAINSRSLLGKGKLSELVARSLQSGANLLIFDLELTPAQVRTLTDYTEMKIIDRSQLILDIFARRARTREGKIQVELAQLRYLLPRLITKNTAMSRLTGGIGGRGPGETKLEINRRRVRDRITKLNKDLTKIRQQRKERRKRRKINDIPVISIVGYTNAGKSTLLNTLTKSWVNTEDRLFVTLDPTSRQLELKGGEAIVTDTVGFIRDLPDDLFEAFAATLEELQEADLIVHVADVSNPRLEDQIESVNRTLNLLRLDHIPTILALNKIDKANGVKVKDVAARLGGIAISALNSRTLSEMKMRMGDIIF